MSYQLFIVESPKKAGVIGGYLGNDFKVVASFGHVRDLPVNEMGVEAPEFKPNYVIPSRSSRAVSTIRSLAKNASAIWLATDDDREGEAVAWHIQQLIGQHTYHRVTFRQVSQSAIQAAIKVPTQINYQYFLAQQARRVIDRLAGYTVSPVISNHSGLKLSAGRVQSPALIMIVTRELAIEAFTSIEHYLLVGHSTFKSDTPWTMMLNTRDFATEDNPYITERAILEGIRKPIIDAGLIVTRFDASKANRRPPAPLTTSSMQQMANNRLSIGVDAAMKAAQLLYESGLITYHRTDDPNLSDEALEMIWDYLRNKGFGEAIPDKKNTWKAKEGSQEAHEAIRPVDFNITKPDTGNQNADNLYQLIWRTAICSQMKPAVYDSRTMSLSTQEPVPGLDRLACFSAKGRQLIYPGWLSMMEEDPATESDEAREAMIPICEVGDLVKLSALDIVTKQTKPPARYSEAKLVKSLEHEGIGRPSTYASIISTLLHRDYVRINKKVLVPTDTGRLVYSYLNGKFCFAQIPFTRDIEQKLDLLAAGQAQYVDIVTQFNEQLTQDVELFKTANPKRAKTPQGSTESQTPDPDTVEHECPQCKGGLHRRKGPKGYFWGCANYPDCRYTAEDNRNKPQKDYKCPDCDDGRVTKRKGRYGPFWGCTNYSIKGCKAMYRDNRGKPVWEKQ